MCSCGTKWSDKKFINDELKICCYCDTYVQPFLSNPLNKINVLKYIPENYQFAVERFGKDFIESIWWTPNK